MLALGFSTIGCPDYDVDQVVALARDNGLKGVEIRHLRGTVDLASLEEFSAARIGETRRKFEDAGLWVVCIGTSVRMNSLDPEVRRKQLEAAKLSLDIAARMGAPYLRVFGGPLPPNQDRERTLDAIATGLGEVAELTAAAGVESLLEVHDDFSTSPAVLDLYARGCSDKLAVLWDTLHSWRFGETAELTWSKLGPRIRHVHLKDANTATPQGFDFALIGEGTVPVMSFVDLLKRVGWDGYLHFEWEKGWHPEIAGPEIAIPHFARYMAGKV